MNLKNAYGRLIQVFNLRSCNSFLRNSSFYISTSDLKRLKRSNKKKPTHTDSDLNYLEPNPALQTKIPLSPKTRKEIKDLVEPTEETLPFSVFSQNLMEKSDATAYMKSLNSTFEGFFSKRDFTLDNFNFLLQIQSKKLEIDEMQLTLEKMASLDIQPDDISYLHLLNAYSKIPDITNAERVFEIIEQKSSASIFHYNALMMSYAKNKQPTHCESIIREMKEKGLEPDIPIYTTLIHSYDMVGNIDKCWEIFNNIRNLNSDINEKLIKKAGRYKKNKIEILAKPLDEDEYLISYMIRLCEKTHDAERAVKLFTLLEQIGFIKTNIHYNSFIFALSSRKDYAKKALEIFQKMKLSGLKPDEVTYTGVLKATAKLGDIYSANEAIKEFRQLGHKVNGYLITGLIRTYAGALRIPFIEDEHIATYVKDAYEIYKYADENSITINSFTLNALLEVYCEASLLDEVDGRIIPLFSKHGVPFTVYTYEVIIKMLLDLRKFDELARVFENMQSNGIEPNQRICNYILEASMRIKSVDGIVGALRKLKEIKRDPYTRLITVLSNLKDMPDRIYVELLHWNSSMINWDRKLRPASFKDKIHEDISPEYKYKDRVNYKGRIRKS